MDCMRAEMQEWPSHVVDHVTRRGRVTSSLTYSRSYPVACVRLSATSSECGICREKPTLTLIRLLPRQSHRSHEF